MERISTEGFPPPPGIINSLKAGFDAIASHVSAIVLPILLSLFFWLGPRLQADVFFDVLKTQMVSISKAQGASTIEIERMVEGFDTISTTNIFWSFRTLPIGISSLLFPNSTDSTPLGAPLVLQTTSFGLFGWIFLLTFFGWVIGGLYFRSVAQIAIKDNSNEETPVGFFRAIIQTILLSIAFTIVSLVIGFPLILFLSIISRFNEFLVNLVVLILSLMSMWIIVPLFFWPHGVFIKNQNFITSILSSVQMARFTLPTSSMFILAVFLLTVGLNYLWMLPPSNSWVNLLGIFGHAFITTGLLAASFIYYRDMNIWLQKVMERIKTGAPRRMV